LLGVSGGISAYKSAALASLLVQNGFGVTVIMTKSATKFVGSTTFAALTGRPVATRLFAPGEHPLGAHIELARRAHLLCIAPATAHELARLALGLADDLLSTVALCFRGPILVAPAMNCEMWEKPSVQRNVQQLRSDGLVIVGPEAGWLSCREQGPGRMAEPETILAAIESQFRSQIDPPGT
jgi:phosphopantothenoylcysteine decarboxylase/phosphopantothenate--cysteine ligase